MNFIHSGRKVFKIDHKVVNNILEISITGILNRDTASNIWQKLQQIQAENCHAHFEVNLQNLSACDTIGLTSLLEFTNKQDQCRITNTPDAFKKLLDTILRQRDNPPPSERKDSRLPPIARIGKQLSQQACAAKVNIGHLGEILCYCAQLIRYPRLLDFKKLFFYIEDIGPGSLPLVILIGVLFGVILSFQSAVQLKTFGAEIYVANLVSVSLIRELGPLLVAIVMMGRSASAYAAEISAMQVNQEIDALKTMALDPVPFLILPRLIAAGIIAPLLTLAMNMAGITGCILLMKTQGYSAQITLHQMFQYLHPSDLASGLIKSILFGLMVVGIGCVNGLNANRDAMAVGRSATNTVVQCIIAITVLDGVFTTVFYYLGL